MNNGSDTWVFLAFAASIGVLLGLDWPLAIVWTPVVPAGMEALRRRHNEPVAE